MVTKLFNRKWLVIPLIMCLVCVGAGAIASKTICPLTGNNYTLPPDIVLPQQVITIDSLDQLELIVEQKEDVWGSILFSEDGQLLAYQVHSGTIVWDVSSGEKTAYFQQVNEGVCGWNDTGFKWVSSVAISSDGSLLASHQGEQGDGGTEKPKLRLWNIQDHHLIRTLEKGFLVDLISPSVDENWLIYSERSNQDAQHFHILDINRDEEILNFQVTGALLGITPSGDTIFYQTMTGINKVDIRTGTQSEIISADLSAGDWHWFVVSRDGSLMASWIYLSTKLDIWNTESAAQIDSLNIADFTESGIGIVAFSPDNRWLVVSSYFGNTGNISDILFWNLETGDSQIRSAGVELAIDTVVTFSPDSKLIAFGGMDGTVRIWDVAEAKELAVLEVRTQARSIPVYPLFSPDGKLLAATNGEGIFLWGIPD